MENQEILLKILERLEKLEQKQETPKAELDHSSMKLDPERPPKEDPPGPDRVNVFHLDGLTRHIEQMAKEANRE